MLKERTFATALLLLAGLEMLPLPAVIWNVIALPFAILSFRRAAGYRSLWLPRSFLRRSVSRKSLQKACDALVPKVRFVERFVRPRFGLLTREWAERLTAAFAGVLATLLILPVPLISWVPAIALFLMALGTFEADGLYVVLGLAVGLVAVILYGTLVFEILVHL